MKVKMKNVMAGPMGTFEVGQEADFEPNFAKGLIDGGYAEALEALPEKETEPETETEPEKETEPETKKPAKKGR